MNKKLMFSTVSALVLTSANNVFASTLTPTLGADSAYTLTQVANKENATFTYLKQDANGQTVEEYYKVDIKPNVVSQDRLENTLTLDPKKSPAFINLSGGNEVYNNERFYGGGAIFNNNGNSNIDITADFIGNHAIKDESYNFAGGAISNASAIGNITGDFINNYVSAPSKAYGGAIYNNPASQIGDITGNFINNYTQSNNGGKSRGGAINNESGSKISTISGDFISNHSISKLNQAEWEGTYIDYAQGGAIYNLGKIENIVNSNFIGNYVSGNAKSNGGAIYNNGTITITAQNNGVSQFRDNYVIANDTKKNNAIYMGAAGAVLNLNATNNSQIIFDDSINGIKGYKLNIKTDDNSSVMFNSAIENANIILNSGNATMTNHSDIRSNNTLTINDGQFNIGSLGKSDVLLINALNLNQNGTLNINTAEVDLANHKMGSIAVGEYNHEDGGKINIKSFLLTSDGSEKTTTVGFATGGIDNDITTTATEAYAPVYKYEVAYDPKTGSFIFTQAGNSNNTGDTPNPTPDYNTYNQGAFANDVFSLAALNMQENAAKTITDMASNKDYTKGRFWALPFYNDETISYKRFYDVDSKDFGLMAGLDSKAYQDANGLTRVYTIFAGFSEGKSKYQGISVENKSWMLGLKETLRKGNFYADALIDYAWHDSHQTTMFGKDSVDTKGYGAALKAGYTHNIDRKLSLDTSAMLSWQEVEGKSYTAKGNAKIHTEDYSRLTLTPEVKLAYQLQNKKPYAIVRYNINLDQSGSSKANNIVLPSIESKNYVEYGIGIEGTAQQDESLYAHILRRDGGHQGWSFTAGYRYNF